MFRESKAFSGFSSDDIAAASKFYGETLGLDVTEADGLLNLRLAGGGTGLIYPKENHEPASFTVLHFPVPDINAAVDELAKAGIELERYEGFNQDERGIARQHGPAIA